MSASRRRYSEQTIADLREYREGDHGTETVYHLGSMGLVDVEYSAASPTSTVGSRLSGLGRSVLDALARDAAQALGRRGGLAGQGPAKRRGDSEHYRAMRAGRKDARRAEVLRRLLAWWDRSHIDALERRLPDHATVQDIIRDARELTREAKEER